jgi:hypothetical protein
MRRLASILALVFVLAPLGALAAPRMGSPGKGGAVHPKEAPAKAQETGKKARGGKTDPHGMEVEPVDFKSPKPGGSGKPPSDRGTRPR